MSGRNTTFLSKVGEMGLGEQGISQIDNLSSEVAMLKLELAQLKEAVTVLSQKQKQAQTTVADSLCVYSGPEN